MAERDNRSLQKRTEQPTGTTVELGREFYVPEFYGYNDSGRAILNPID